MSCKPRQAIVSEQSQTRTQLDQWHRESWLHAANWVIIDSLIILSNRDTVQQVRRVSVSVRESDTLNDASSVLLTDTCAEKSQINRTTTITAESKKSGGLAERAERAVGKYTIFLIFVAAFVVCLKKCLPLRRQ